MKYFWADGHCDTLARSLNSISVIKNDGQFDFTRALANGSGLQVMALFPGNEGQFYEKAIKQLDALDAALSETGISLCRSGGDVRELYMSGKFGVMASLEGADALEGDLSRLEIFYKRGVRLLGLTWNGDNALCGGIGADSSGLTELGREGIRLFEELGGIIDVSHASQQGFAEALSTSAKPVIASHSCCRALCVHKRNLSDAQLIAIADKGGVTGINFYPPFLSDSGNASLSDAVSHILHAVKICGEDAVGLGSDFDGIEKAPDGLAGIQDTQKIIAALEADKISGRVIEKVIGGNFRRVFEENIK